jgi:hypothetical protein
MGLYLIVPAPEYLRHAPKVLLQRNQIAAAHEFAVAHSGRASNAMQARF